jgi:hypothetical protein
MIFLTFFTHTYISIELFYQESNIILAHGRKSEKTELKYSNEDSEKEIKIV